MTTTTLRIENIPDALQEQPRWLAWRFETRDDKETKVPMSPATRRLADVTDPDCWTDFADCLSSVNRQGGYFSGIGFALGDGWAGVDFDDCRDPETGELHPAALEMIRALDSYSEVSPSGEGVKVFLRADLGDRKGHKKLNMPWGGDIEVYWTARYFTVTGARLGDCPATVEDHQLVD